MAKQIKSSDLFEEEDIFKGLRDSALKTIEIFDKLSLGMKQSAEEMKKSVNDNVLTTTKSIEKLMQTSSQASKLQEDSIKIDKAKAEALKQYAIAEQQLEKIEQEKEKTAQQRIRTSEQIKKAENDEIKRSQQKVKAAQDEQSAYKQLAANTRDLKNQSKELGAQLTMLKDAGETNSDAFRELQQRYNQVTQAASEADKKLKDIDKSVGDNQRSVGDYEKATVGLREQLRKLTMALADMDESDPRFAKMAMEAGELSDKIADTQAVVKGLAGTGIENLANGMVRAGQVGIAAFQGLESSMVLLGVENEAVLESMQKLQALAGMADALQTLGGLGDAITEIKASLIGAATKMGLFTAAKEVDIVVTEAQAIATTEATVAQEGLNVAMSANPIGLVIAGIVALGAAVAGVVYYLNRETEAEKKARIEQEKLAKQREANAKLAKETAEYVGKESGSYASLIYSLKATVAGSKERVELMQQINNEYGTTLQNLSDEYAFQEQLNKSVEDYIAVQYNKFKLQKNQEAFDKQLETRFALEQKQNKLMQEFYKERAKKGESVRIDIPGQAFRDEILKEDETLGNYRRRMGLFNDDLTKIEQQLAANENATTNLGLSRNQLLATDTKLTNNGKVYVKQNTQNTKTTNNLTNATADLNTEFAITNEYLSKQIALLDALDQLQKDREIAAADQEIAAKRANDLKLVNETGELQVDALEELIAKKYKLEQDAIMLSRDAQISAIKETYRLEGEEELKAIEANKKELLAQEKLTPEAKLEIEANYQKELQQYKYNELQRNADLELEIRKLNEESKVLIVDNEKKKNDEINDANEELNNAQEEYYDNKNEKKLENDEKEIQAEKDKLEAISAVVDASAEFFISRSEKKIAQIEKEKDAAQKQFALYQELAANGNINAQQSLAEQQKIIDKAELKKEKELKKQQRIKLAQSVFETYQSKVEAGKENPIADTIKDTTLLLQFINSLPTFYDGTEDTGANGKGVDGRGGFHAILHPNERVVPKTLNDKINGISNEELTKLAVEYNNGSIVRKGEANQVSSALEFGIMIEKLDRLNETIQNKPEHSYDVGRISSTLLEFVDRKKQGNTTTYNRYKVRK